VQLQAGSSRAAAAADGGGGGGSGSGGSGVDPRDGTAALHCFASFLGALTNRDADGRIIIEPANAQAGQPPPLPQQKQQLQQQPAGSSSSDGMPRSGQLRFVLLNSASQFGGLLASARSVVLVSGAHTAGR
jgi:hypothetical protein